MKVLFADAEKCTGCKLCALACSLKHEGLFSLLNSRIRIKEDEVLGMYMPYVCEQCGEHPCVDTCPVNAITYDAKTAIFKVDRDTCIGCGNCVQVCPYSSIFLGHDGKALKCDLCDGSPECVNYCIVGALQFLDATKGIIKLKIKNMLVKIGE
jgi:Fe-S-cluster-containing hydrogenase component 2